VHVAPGSQVPPPVIPPAPAPAPPVPVVAPAPPPPSGLSPPVVPPGGYAQLYIKHVQQANLGADLDFLVGSRGHEVTRESH